MPRNWLFPLSFLVLAALLVFPGAARAQPIHPSSIIVDDAAACGGGVDTVDEVCITLPSLAACETVDVFLLLDATGSFGDEIAATKMVFESVVMQLESDFPGVSFAFGSGQFQDFPGFGGKQSDDPFVLVQSLLPGEPVISTSTVPGDGGDTPESAIEALYQVATGAGLPGFVEPYTGDGLGGVGWRPESCLRLVLVPTDACTVAPFSDPPAAGLQISGAGSAQVGASEFDCPGEQRYGQVGSVAPAGAATVQGTVDALNALGIRVLGLRDGTQSTDPQAFLSALATLTGVNGQGVFDLDAPGGIEAALTSAVAESVTAPVDVAVVPNPEVPGLSVTTDPPVWTDLDPGGTACFDVTFEGDSSFEGGTFSLDFVDAGASGAAPLGQVPVTLECEDCFRTTSLELLCETDEDGWTGGYTWRFVVRNQSADDVHHLFFADLPAGVTVEPAHVVFDPPMKHNHPRLVEVVISGSGVAPGPLDFLITLHDASLAECCAERVELELPDCDCAQVVGTSGPSCFFGPKGFSFDLENLAGTAVEHLLFAAVDPNDHALPLDPSQVTITPNPVTLSPAVGPGEETGSIPLSFSGPQAQPGDEVCFRISTHDSGFDRCCSIVRCVGIPDCTLGPIDFEPVGTAELVRSGSLVVLGGLAGGGGALASFAPSDRIGLSVLDYAHWVEIPPDSLVRFEAAGSDSDLGTSPAAGVTAWLDGVVVRVEADEALAAVDGVEVRLAGEVVARPRARAVRALGWPTGFAIERGSGMEVLVGRSNGAAGMTAVVSWREPVRFRLGGGSRVTGDEVVFHLRPRTPVAAIERALLSARGIPTLAIDGGEVDPPPP